MLRLPRTFLYGCNSNFHSNCGGMFARNYPRDRHIQHNKLLARFCRYLEASKTWNFEELKQEIRSIAANAGLSQAQKETASKCNNNCIHMPQTGDINVKEYEGSPYVKIKRPTPQLPRQPLDVDWRSMQKLVIRTFSTKVERLPDASPVSSVSLKSFRAMYPQPKHSLNHIFITLATHFRDNSYKLAPYFEPLRQVQGKTHWRCTYSLKWPESASFRAEASTKQEASTQAALEALHHLHERRNIKGNAPVLPDLDAKLKEAKEKARVLKLAAESETALEKIVQIYESQLTPQISNFLMRNEDQTSDDTKTLIANENIWPIQSQITAGRFKGVHHYCLRENLPSLPIDDFKESIIEATRSSRVVIIKGEPGCGKSTRVPQFILEGWARSYSGSENCNVVVTQPRRIAAIALAERVASERAEPVGKTVGYQVRLKSNFNRSSGRILYCTTGILLRRLQSDPGLEQCSHVLLDEAHERDVSTDLLLNLLKAAMRRNDALRVLVMSATIQTGAFRDYFDECGAQVLQVPGRTHPVRVHFLEEQHGLPQTLRMSDVAAPSVLHDDVVRLLQHIHASRPPGAVLVFLPGWEDIQKVRNALPSGAPDLHVFSLHSRMPVHEQRRIFHQLPPGVRKVVLATNIAETSVTIDDVVYVLDAGIVKEKRFDVEKGVSVVDSHWISKASMAQRKGRAGRVRPGEAFLLYTPERYAQFAEYATPEIARTSLTKSLLDSKVYSNNMKAADFFCELITPPDESSLYHAVDELIELELLDADENLTPLGRVISNFQLEPRLAKALVNSVIYKCVTPVVDVVTLYSAETELFDGGLDAKERIHRVKKTFSQSSDHLGMMRLLEQWLDHAENRSDFEAKRYCQEQGLVSHKLEMIQQLRGIHFDYLHKGLHDILRLSDDFSDSDELVKSVLLSGVGSVLKHQDFDVVKGQLKRKHLLLTRHGHKATVAAESVNFKRTRFPSDFLLYINETRSNVRRMTVVRETSLISSVAVLLFKNRPLSITEVTATQHQAQAAAFSDPVMISLDDTSIKLLTSRETANLLVKCKDALTNMMEYYIYQLTKGGEYDQGINQLWDDILKLLSVALSREASQIDN